MGGIGEEHFYGAIQIVDLYHAREHLALIAKLVYGASAIKSKAWLEARREQLDAADVEAVIASLRRLRPSHTKVQEAVRTAADYFHTNAERMRYAQFRKHGLFVGSGVMEAGCKTICGQRLKQSAMHWTVRGATPFSPCAAANSALAGKNSRRLVHSVSSFHPQICRTPGFFGGDRFAKYDGAPTTAIRMSGPIRTAIMSFATCSPDRTPAS